MAVFELKDTTKKEEKRLIIYTDVDENISTGVKVNNKSLYELYLLLRELFKEQAEIEENGPTNPRD